MRRVDKTAQRLKINATSAPAFSQRAANAIAAVHIATKFAMDAMLGRHATQLKMPRPDAYGPSGPGQGHTPALSARVGQKTLYIDKISVRHRIG
jgi:hypothetical protein